MVTREARDGPSMPRSLAPTKRGASRFAACDKRESLKCETRVSYLIQHVPLGQKVEQ